MSNNNGPTRWKRRKNDFENAKAQCLGKRDKSFAGRIDPHAVEICGIINNERDEYYTTSSCAGRCFMYRGSGIKATTNFQRFRISHETIQNPKRFFDLTTIDTDPTGGGDPIRTIGQYDYKNMSSPDDDNNNNDDDNNNDDGRNDVTDENDNVIPSNNTEETEIKQHDDDDDDDDDKNNRGGTIWLRFEPFILHVACRSLKSASALMAAARPAFKNVGLTTWKEKSRYLVAIWGDEGLEMPLCTPEGQTLPMDPIWLAQLVNERHERNWSKIQRFCKGVREMSPSTDANGNDYDNDENDDDYGDNNDGAGGEDDEGQGTSSTTPKTKIPKSFDVIGDIAYLHSMPEGDAEAVGTAIMAKNKSIKLVVARQSNLIGTERAPGDDGLSIIAGPDRSPLMTSHVEYGIKCVVDLNHTFFSPRMAKERLRICQQVARGEDVLVCFAGIGMEALQIAGRTEARTVTAVELNSVAIQCARLGHRMLERNKKSVKCAGAADRLEIIEGDVLDVLPNQFAGRMFDRILAPRPKEGSLDGDLGKGDGGEEFLDLIVQHLNKGTTGNGNDTDTDTDHNTDGGGGECHWYDFVADHEFPDCQRTKSLIRRVCAKHGLDMKVLHVAHVGSVAMRQIRICMDFKVFILPSSSSSS